jgi:Sulfotransferase domain
MAMQSLLPLEEPKVRVSSSKRPDFFIVGAPKCGTTAMAQYLRAHPEIYMPVVKEMHLFGSDLHFTGGFYRRRMDAYLAEYASRNSQTRSGEASVWYLYSTRAAEEIHAFEPDANIIIMLRNPADMVYSLYYQFSYDGNEHLPTFEQALDAEDDRRSGRRITRHTHFVRGLVYRDTALFTDQVRRYFDVFGRNRVKVIIYDDFASNPAAIYGETLDFLGVDSTVMETEFPVVNSTKYIKSALLRGIMNDRLLRRTVHAICAHLPRKVFTTLRRADGKIWRSNTRQGKRPPISPAMRSRLQRHFAPEVERLGDLLDRDLTHWSR